MNDESLNKMLDSLAIPPLGEAVREKAAHRALIAFAHRHVNASEHMPITGRWIIALACVAAIVICLGVYCERQSRGGDFSEAKLLVEMEALFPGQLDGVIKSEGNISLDLAQDAHAAFRSTSQPLAVTLRRGRQIVRVLSYSGRKVCVSLGGRKHCLEPLVTAEGKVIVEGDDFLWTDARPMRVAGYRLEARTLAL